MGADQKGRDHHTHSGRRLRRAPSRATHLVFILFLFGLTEEEDEEENQQEHLGRRLLCFSAPPVCSAAAEERRSRGAALDLENNPAACRSPSVQRKPCAAADVSSIKEISKHLCSFSNICCCSSRNAKQFIGRKIETHLGTNNNLVLCF